MKKFLLIVLLTCSTLMLSGCGNELTPEERINESLIAMQDVNKYLLRVEYSYSDEETTIGASFKSNIGVDNEINYFDGMINCNDETFDTLGYITDKYMVIEDIYGEYAKINIPVINIKDLSFTNIRKIDNKDGYESLDYYSVKINNIYDARIGVGKEDNIIYTIYIDLSNTVTDRVIGIYELNIIITDDNKDVNEMPDTKYDYETNNISSILNISGGEENAPLE